MSEVCISLLGTSLGRAPYHIASDDNHGEFEDFDEMFILTEESSATSSSSLNLKNLFDKNAIMLCNIIIIDGTYNMQCKVLENLIDAQEI